MSISRAILGFTAALVTALPAAVAYPVTTDRHHSSASASIDSPLPIAVSIPPHRWLVERLGGDQVEVICIIAPGDGHETFQPSDQQASQVLRCRLYVAAGLPFEKAAWFAAIRRSPSVRVLDLNAGIQLRRLESSCDHSHEHEHGHEHGHGHGHDGNDPHTWLSPRLLRTQADTLATAMIAADPDRADAIRTRLAALQKELTDLDTELARTLAPSRGRAVLVFHPAWGYFLDAYGIEQIAVEQHGKPPSDQELTALQRLARERGMRTILVEPQVGGRAAQRLAAAIGGEIVVLDPVAADVPANLRAAAAAIARAAR